MSKSVSRSFIKEAGTSQERSSSSLHSSVDVLAKYDSSFEAVPDFNVTAPLVNGLGKVTDILVLPCPLLMIAPLGTDQM
jgi:hypothetical protein